MIVSNQFVRTFLFGSKVARIRNESFECCISTAKEGLFQKQSTVILEPKAGAFGAGAAGLHPCGKIIYSPTLRRGDRFQFHDAISKTLDSLGEEGRTLGEALDQIFTDLKRRGVAVETINLAAGPDQAEMQLDLDRYKKAAEQGNAEAQFTLGHLYDQGRDVGQNYAQAAAWYRKAAEQGYSHAQYALGRLYRYGLGVPEDFAEATFWSDIASAGDSEVSLEGFTAAYLDKAASYMSPTDFSRLQQMVRKWFDDHPAKPR